MKSYSDPKMHTAEHLLNAAMVELIGTDRSFNAHIEKKKSKVDYRFDRNVTDEEVKAVEERVRACIAEDIPVTEEFFSREEAEERFSLRKLPESAGDTIRIVRIGEYDAVPCIGEHVGSTGEIGVFSITSRSFSDNVLRLRFKTGRTAS